MEKAKIEALNMPSELAGQFLALREFEIRAEYELRIDAYLHNSSNGPYHLARPELAAEVINSYIYLHSRAELFVYVVCVMSNHVHAVVRAPDEVDAIDPGKLMMRHKSHTARKCNQLLGLTNRPFWDESYFDRTVRHGKFTRVMWYVLNNPVKAGLVDNWREWPHCWLNPEYAALFT